jgi:hypothetical protein
MDKKFWLTFVSLVNLIFGLILFLTSILYFDKYILLISLGTIMSGSVGFYLLKVYPQLYPLNLKRKKN